TIILQDDFEFFFRTDSINFTCKNDILHGKYQRYKTLYNKEIRKFIESKILIDKSIYIECFQPIIQLKARFNFYKDRCNETIGLKKMKKLYLSDLKQCISTKNRENEQYLDVTESELIILIDL
ncbi:hypothetical protein COBT_004252, partial [Conglomerata obtusa]